MKEEPAEIAGRDQWHAMLRDEHPELWARVNAMAGAVLRGWPVPCAQPSCEELFDNLREVEAHAREEHGLP